MPDKRRWLPCWQRIELVEKCETEGLTRRQAAAWRRVSVSTVQCWVDRYRQASPAERESGRWAEDRPSTPQHQPTLTSEADHDRVCQARAATGWGPRLIAGKLGMPHATVSRCLQRRGMSRIAREPKPPCRRFEWPCPGDLLQMDTKQFARFSSPGHAVTGDRHRSGREKRERVGYEIAHSVIDDHSRLAYTELHRDATGPTVVAFLQRALAFYAAHAITARRLQTDNAFAYTKNAALAQLLAAHAIAHRTTPPRWPQANGKIERYQQTLKREWGLGQRHRSATARAAALPHRLRHYNRTRPHSAIGNQPPINRVRNDPRQNS
jgi:transposase InsO family protein